jgi:hypothetical protein
VLLPDEAGVSPLHPGYNAVVLGVGR